jgi:hypothetical protein
MPGLEAGIKLHCAEDFACQLEWSKEKSRHYRYEYLFEWRIPESLVVHRITMATLLRRGFSLHQLCGHTTFADFPKMCEFRTLIRYHWKDLCLFERGYKAGAAACLFGFHSLTGRLAAEILGLKGNQNPFGPVKEGIEDALETYASSIGDKLVDYEVGLGDLSEAAAFLDYEYATEAEEIMEDCLDQPGAIGHALILLEKRYRTHRAVLEKRLGDIYLDIGF